MVSEELKFINGFIGFFKPSGETWPSPFVNEGYEVTGLEHPVQTLVNNTPRSPVPELVCASGYVQHCILLEAKSGSLNDRQAKAYQAVTADQIVTQGLAPETVDPRTARVDAVYLASSENAQRLSDDLSRAGLQFPLIESHPAMLRLREGTISYGRMHRVFEAGISVEEHSWPTHFVKCDRNSSDGELAAVCIQKFVASLYREGTVGIGDLAAASIDFWDIRGGEDQQRMRTRLVEIITEAERTEFAGEFQREGKNQRWKLSREGRPSPQAMARLSRLATEFVNRKQDGRPFVPGQPPLFPYSATDQ